MKVAAFLLADKMIIETTNKKDAGTWYSTGEYTILPLRASDVELGNCVLNHLKQSQEKDVSYDQIRENYKLIIKKAGFKTEKAFLQYIKRVSIIIEDRKMVFEPFLNTKNPRKKCFMVYLSIFQKLNMFLKMLKLYVKS